MSENLPTDRPAVQQRILDLLTGVAPPVAESWIMRELGVTQHACRVACLALEADGCIVRPTWKASGWLKT